MTENSKKWNKKHLFEIFTCKLTVKRAIGQKAEKTRKKGPKNTHCVFQESPHSLHFCEMEFRPPFLKMKTFLNNF
jgi:hypothetical protein